MNDSFRTNVFVRFHPETIAAACIYLAARVLKVNIALAVTGMTHSNEHNHMNMLLGRS